MANVIHDEAVSPLDFRYYGNDPEFMKWLLPYVGRLRTQWYGLGCSTVRAGQGD